KSQSVSAEHLAEELKSLRNGKVVTHQGAGNVERVQPQQHQYSGGVTPCGINSVISTSLGNLQGSNYYQTQQQLQYHSLTEISPHRSNMNQYDLHVRIAAPENIHTTCSVNSETDSEHGGLNDETSSTTSDKYERDVAVLNHCFDDIEKFIARLQHAAAATRELERRRNNRKTKKKDPGEGLLTMRTRPPHEEEFVDIFAKFKLSFNLLAKLRAHIHDPNAPELVHFLFTPLALIVEASSDTYYESQLPSLVVNPLLTREAINLLINCVTSKETELWRSLGQAWIIPREQWKSDTGSYNPIFMDGWSPDYEILDKKQAHCTQNKLIKSDSAASAHISVSHRSKDVGGNRLNRRNNSVSKNNLYTGQSEEKSAITGKYPYCYENEGGHFIMATSVGGCNSNALIGDLSTRSEISIDSIERSGTDTHGVRVNGIQEISSGMQQLHLRDTNRTTGTHSLSDFCVANKITNDPHALKAWLNDLQAANAKIVLVTYPRTANNDKELSVMRGEYLEILDDTRKWWKARNIQGQVAHVPNTIVTPYLFSNDCINNSCHERHIGLRKENNKYFQSFEGNIFRNDNFVSQQSLNTSDWIRSKNACKEGELRYFE
ncbi:epidermal growth factor receptor kinase substrate 8, partial [Eurosta solidaginis]|uniref:epidermal growth factor receptor kinase substrate 8 n=1 Tax=Eurosta solidaginis TaxID=178769 RepID=UPI003530F0EB